MCCVMESDGREERGEPGKDTERELPQAPGLCCFDPAPSRPATKHATTRSFAQRTSSTTASASAGVTLAGRRRRALQGPGVLGFGRSE